LGVGLPSLALAQDADDEILVTGSRIPSANAIATSPVTTIGNVEFDIRGTTRVEDLINTLPQSFALQGSNVSNGATGTAQVALRGLGSVRTLVLVDGRRLQYGSSISSAPDLNQIPGALVERVDILTGGSSAVYGSDAVAGVVNFIMIKDFEGVRIDGQVHGYQHTNDNSVAQNTLAARGFSPPEDGVFDGKGQDITLIIGANTEDGRGNVTAYAGYRNNDAILQRDRDYSACAFGGGLITPANPNGFTCGGSLTSVNGTFFTPSGTFTLDENNPNEFRPINFATDVFNFAPDNYYQRPDERYTLGAFAHYEINEHFDVYSQAMFYDYTSDAQIAFSGTFFVPSSINCDNPLLSMTQATIICGGNAGVPGTTGTVYPGKRLSEGLPRNDHIRLTSFRVVGGVRGEVFEGWNYDAFFQYANTHNAQQYENDVIIPNMLNALDVIDVGAGPQCRVAVTGQDPNCVPLNIWRIGGVTPAAVAYISGPSFQDGNTYQYMGQATLTGDLGQYGMKSPWAEDGIGLAGGFEWRKDQLVYRPDQLFQSGQLAGQGGTQPATSGSIETTDFFVEAEIPLVSGMEFAELLKFNGGYRHSDVSTSGGYSTWKLTGDWQFTPEVRVRGGWQRAARASNVIESFSPQQTGLTALTFDPCAGAMPVASLTACMNTGVTMGQYGSIADNPAGQYNGVFGGNPNLDPEVSDTYTVGVVLTPGDYVPGNLLLSVDYFDITVDGFIGTILAQDAMDNCLASGDPFFCGLIFRNPNNGSLWQGNTTGFVLTNLNTGSLATSGVDINADYTFDFADIGLGDAGGMNINFVGTYLIDLTVESLPGSTPFDCAGLYSGRCGTPNPEWRHKLRTTWEMPIGVDFSVSWRMFSSVDLEGVTVNPLNRTHTLETRHYIDLAASYNVFDNWNVRVGVNNVLDKDPPLTNNLIGGPPFGNGNTYPQVYDAQGRFLFIGTTIDF
jgi:outer membrane receptor protein involved in Fe transport